MHRIRIVRRDEFRVTSILVTGAIEVSNRHVTLKADRSVEMASKNTGSLSIHRSAAAHNRSHPAGYGCPSRPLPQHLIIMDKNDRRREQPDAGLAAETRPIPSQAEGEDEEVAVKDTS